MSKKETVLALTTLFLQDRGSVQRVSATGCTSTSTSNQMHHCNVGYIVVDFHQDKQPDVWLALLKKPLNAIHDTARLLSTNDHILLYKTEDQEQRSFSFSPSFSMGATCTNVTIYTYICFGGFLLGLNQQFREEHIS